MKKHINGRVKDVALYVIASRCTVRQAAEVFGISKSTIHKDLAERLPLMDSVTAEEVNRILQVNKEQRHIRGGEATRRKYKEM